MLLPWRWTWAYVTVSRSVERWACHHGCYRFRLCILLPLFLFLLVSCNKEAPRAPYEQGWGVKRDPSEAILNSALTTGVNYLHSCMQIIPLQCGSLFLNSHQHVRNTHSFPHIYFPQEMVYGTAVHQCFWFFWRDLEWGSQIMTLQSR